MIDFLLKCGYADMRFHIKHSFQLNPKYANYGASIQYATLGLWDVKTALKHRPCG